MDKIINKLFSDYLSEQSFSSETDYAALVKCAMRKEEEFRNMLDKEQTECFEELFEISSKIHFFEVKDAFYNACKIGAEASKDLNI